MNPQRKRLQAAVSLCSILFILSLGPAFPAQARSSGAFLQTGATSIGTWQTISIGVPSPRTGHTAVWTGAEMIVWGGSDERYPVAGGSRLNGATHLWTPLSNSGAPTPRGGHTAVWTGTEMIIWGGSGEASALQDGARYDPKTDHWTSLEAAGAPSPRAYHTAVWTGTEMIIWGGSNGITALNDGARYNPATGSWAALPAASAPAPRESHTVVWTGGAPGAGEMIVWGGVGGSTYRGDGARYNPADNTWTPLPAAGAPAPRANHTAVWTGSEMIIWGGWDGAAHRNDGARYNPSLNTWTPVTPESAPLGRANHTAVWTGKEMIIWGGGYYASVPPYKIYDYLHDGARYDPVADRWAGMSYSDYPPPREGHTAVWTGGASGSGEMLVFGGNRMFMYGDGRRYDPSSDQWLPLSADGAPSPRRTYSTIWTGSEMIIWGGYDDWYDFGDGSAYNPAFDRWRLLAKDGAPSPRMGHTAVWTGSEMLIWGGADGGRYNDGGRYDPVKDRWRSISTDGAPTGRVGHSVVWTGGAPGAGEMIVWGGYDNFSAKNDGARYNPVTDQWKPISTKDAPLPRFDQLAVWTGGASGVGEMLIWGGDAGAQTYLADGGRYNPATDSWKPIATTGAPDPAGASVVWTGSEMIVWSGPGPGQSGRYNPASDSWAPISIIGAPQQGSVLWTGAEMLVWGGPDQGARYDPLTDQWTPLPKAGAPANQGGFSIVWANLEMILWSGELRTGGRLSLYQALYLPVCSK